MELSKKENNAKFCKDNKWNVDDRYSLVPFLRVSSVDHGAGGGESVTEERN